jgi:hypothetical protein
LLHTDPAVSVGHPAAGDNHFFPVSTALFILLSTLINYTAILIVINYFNNVYVSI